MLILLFLLSMLTASPLYAEPLNFHETMMRSSAALGEKKPDIVVPCASIFAFTHHGRTYLVTAKHVLESLPSPNFDYLPPYSEKGYGVDLYSPTNEIRFISHPTQDVSLIFPDKSIPCSITSSQIATNEDLTNLQLGTKVFSVNFPLGSLLPKLREGILNFDLRDQNKEFYVSMEIFEGASGAPVYSLEKEQVIGIISKTDKHSVTTDPERVTIPLYINNGYVVPSKYIWELLNQTR